MTLLASFHQTSIIFLKLGFSVSLVYQIVVRECSTFSGYQIDL